MRLVLVGTSYQRAPVELRELLAYDPALRSEALGRLGAEGAEAAVLSTCNRTEVYGVSGEPAELEERIYGELADLSGLSHSELAPALYSVSDEAAAVHLFRVAAGLDSMVPGEAQILGQVREAYEAARESETTRATLHRLFRQALRVGKRVRTETAIGENPASVSSAAAQLAERVFEDLAGRRILLLGAGKTADLTAANLISRGVGEIVVVNRSPERGEALARRFGGRAVGLDRVEAGAGRGRRGRRVHQLAGLRPLRRTGRAGHEGAPRPADLLHRHRRPADVDPAVIELEGCYLYDIDDLERVVAESVAGRREEAVRAEAIVSEEADAFRAWQLSLDVVPAISSLRARAESIRREELERAEGRLASLSPSQRRAVEALTSQIVAKLLHQPTVRMKEAAAGAEGVLYADAVRHLFGLGDDAGQARKPRQ